MFELEKNIDDEKYKNKISGMIDALSRVVVENNTRITYKLGKNKIKNLGISIPHRYNSVKQSNGLVEIGIRTILMRLRFDGWDNETLNKVYDENNLGLVSSQAIESSLVCGVGFISVGEGDVSNGEPKIVLASENPNEVFALYNRQKGRVTQAIKVTYSDDKGNVEGYLFVEGLGMRSFNKNDSQSYFDLSDWRDTKLSNNRVPIIALCNNQTFDGKIGHSEISEQWISVVDSQTRTMQALELAREFSVFPKQVFFGADAEDFAGKDGMSQLVNRFNLISSSEAKVQELGTANINSLLELIQAYNRTFAQVSDLPESYFGLSNTANPASAESRTIAENGLINKCTYKIDSLSGSFRQLGNMITELLGDDFVIDEGLDMIQSLTPNFRDPSTPSNAAQVANVTQLVSAGILDPSSESTLRELGWNRHRIDMAQREASLGKAIGLLDGLNLNKEVPAITETIANDLEA